MLDILSKIADNKVLTALGLIITIGGAGIVFLKFLKKSQIQITIPNCIYYALFKKIKSIKKINEAKLHDDYLMRRIGDNYSSIVEKLGCAYYNGNNSTKIDTILGIDSPEYRKLLSKGFIIKSNLQDRFLKLIRAKYIVNKRLFLSVDSLEKLLNLDKKDDDYTIFCFISGLIENNGDFESFYNHVQSLCVKPTCESKTKDFILLAKCVYNASSENKTDKQDNCFETIIEAISGLVYSHNNLIALKELGDKAIDYVSNKLPQIDDEVVVENRDRKQRRLLYFLTTIGQPLPDEDMLNWIKKPKEVRHPHVKYHVIRTVCESSLKEHIKGEKNSQFFSGKIKNILKSYSADGDFIIRSESLFTLKAIGKNNKPEEFNHCRKELLKLLNTSKDYFERAHAAAALSRYDGTEEDTIEKFIEAIDREIIASLIKINDPTYSDSPKELKVISEIADAVCDFFYKDEKNRKGIFNDDVRKKYARMILIRIKLLIIDDNYKYNFCLSYIKAYIADPNFVSEFEKLNFARKDRKFNSCELDIISSVLSCAKYIVDKKSNSEKLFFCKRFANKDSVYIQHIQDALEVLSELYEGDNSFSFKDEIHGPISKRIEEKKSDNTGEVSDLPLGGGETEA